MVTGGPYIYDIPKKIVQDERHEYFNVESDQFITAIRFRRSGPIRTPQGRAQTAPSAVPVARNPHPNPHIAMRDAHSRARLTGPRSEAEDRQASRQPGPPARAATSPVTRGPPDRARARVTARTVPRMGTRASSAQPPAERARPTGVSRHPAAQRRAHG